MILSRARWMTAVMASGLACFVPLAAAAERAPKVTAVAVPHAGQPVVARCDAEGMVHLVCDSPDGPRYLRSSDKGKTFSAPIGVVDDAARQPGLEFNVWDMVVGPGGVVHVAMGTNAWKLKLPRDEWGFFYARLERGQKSFSPVRSINHRPSEGFSLAADQQGNVTACWLADKLFANVSHDNGATFGQTIEIDTSFNPCNCCTTSCTYAADGKLAILYREETDDDRNMFLALWDQVANRATRRQVSSTLWNVDSCPMTYYSITAAGDGFVAAWPTRGEIYFARLDSQGEALPPGEVKTPGSSGMRTGLLALSDTRGNVLVTWKKDDKLGWQLYDPHGRAVGPAGSASSPGKGAAGVVNKDGDFVLFR